MEITCIADLHGFLPELPGGDLLIVAGDLTARHTEREFYDFADWIRSQEYEDKIVICGNHDTWINLEADAWDIDNWCDTGEFEYLCDSGTEFEYEKQIDHPASTEHASIDVLMYEKKKIKIWGTPWTLTFPGINPHCTAFTGTEEELEAKFDMIPDDVDILISHGPPFGTLNKNIYGESVGSLRLTMALLNRPSIFLHIFGHIHESYGRKGPNIPNKDERTFINCSHVNEHYQPVNKPVSIIL